MLFNALTLLVASVPSYFKQEAAGEKGKCWKPSGEEQHTASELLGITATLQSRSSESSTVRERQNYRHLRAKVGENMPQILSKIFLCDNEWKTSVWKILEELPVVPQKNQLLGKKLIMYEKHFWNQLWKVKKKKNKACNWNIGPNRHFESWGKKPKEPHKKPHQPEQNPTEWYLYLNAHLLAGKPDLDLPWDSDLQQEKNKAQQSSQWACKHVELATPATAKSPQAAAPSRGKALVLQADLPRESFSSHCRPRSSEEQVQAREAPQQSSSCQSHKTPDQTPTLSYLRVSLLEREEQFQGSS